ncbi:hypothetical protein C8J40_11314 [Sphingomonas sp. PP-CC-3A-396]|nr:hypothetical protein C8J40_11314 [Sphingomonas sp. PP-CC-3A-396]
MSFGAVLIFGTGTFITIFSGLTRDSLLSCNAKKNAPQEPTGGKDVCVA